MDFTKEQSDARLRADYTRLDVLTIRQSTYVLIAVLVSLIFAVVALNIMDQFQVAPFVGLAITTVLGVVTMYPWLTNLKKFNDVRKEMKRRNMPLPKD